MDKEYEFTDNILKNIGAPAYQKETIIEYIEEIIDYMVSSGVPREVAVSKKCKGTVARGVNDLWNYGSGEVNLSPYFKERVIQLSYPGESETTQHDSCVEPIEAEEIKEIVEEVL